LNAPPGSTLLAGGARSGKSDLAVRLARAWAGPVTFVATADARDDADLAARVARHRAERPPAWTTVEEPRDVVEGVRGADANHLVVVDCVTIWVSNLMVGGLDEDGGAAAARALLDAVRARTTPTILVTNEVGMGVHPATGLGRAYRDVLGRVNRVLGDGCDRAVLVVAGRALPLVDLETAFP
jgi:adenosyl cobinamide kinase/adenosyl cobinamide phosphate guanylyltransferase